MTERVRQLLARVRLVPETDEERAELGVCAGSARPPIPGSAGWMSGVCGGCGVRVALESDGLTRNHPG